MFKERRVVLTSDKETVNLDPTGTHNETGFPTNVCTVFVSELFT